MEYVGKAMVGNQVKSLTKGLGLDEEEEEDKGIFKYDPKKEQLEEEKRAQEKAKRQEAHTKRKAERAVKRNEIREKYGLKESKVDKDLVEGRHQPADEKKDSLTKAKEDESVSRYEPQSKDKEKCAIM
ncbi:uncharacterized protein [Amphiura filiformis]|uniref:uncharacterized protein n=1 Tax=Amphiura filiformis TaxID=82378 RepID=UPI003B20EE83